MPQADREVALGAVAAGVGVPIQLPEVPALDRDGALLLVVELGKVHPAQLGPQHRLGHPGQLLILGVDGGDPRLGQGAVHLALDQFVYDIADIGRGRGIAAPGGRDAAAALVVGLALVHPLAGGLAGLQGPVQPLLPEQPLGSGGFAVGCHHLIAPFSIG